MNKESVFIEDKDLASASESDLRAHYEALAREYEEFIGPQKVELSSEELVQQFAGYMGCRASRVVHIPAAEAPAPYLFYPLTSEELIRVNNWTVLPSKPL